VIIAGGGTGGHFFPGLAVAQALRAEAPGTRVLFVGTERGVEARLAPQHGFPFLALKASGFAGVGLLKRIRAVASVPFSLLSAIRVLLRFKPGAVIGVGGYASLPVALAAGLMRLPVLLLEQNVQPGLSNRLLSPFSSALAVAFPQTARFFGRKARLVGNPVRASLEAVGAEFPPEQPLRLLVFGGSRGARAVNDAVVAAIPALKSFPGGIEIMHQTGPEDLERVRAAYAEQGFSAKVEPFIDDMDRAYSWCHAVLCRAGATTLAELCVVARPSLLIPFPHAAGAHQTLNAKGLAELGGALWVEQSALDTETLVERLTRLADPAARAAMAEKLRYLARPDAAREIASLVKVMAGGAP
jgi:UDP-N-acetylglucosamine--N-acetylmuramyl-(pentapeptide) pyrophosphoryl-undecaprenol N-acetylglucosamine transferase